MYCACLPSYNKTCFCRSQFQLASAFCLTGALALRKILLSSGYLSCKAQRSSHVSRSLKTSVKNSLARSWLPCVRLTLTSSEWLMLYLLKSPALKNLRDMTAIWDYRCSRSMTRYLGKLIYQQCSLPWSSSGQSKTHFSASRNTWRCSRATMSRLFQASVKGGQMT